MILKSVKLNDLDNIAEIFVHSFLTEKGESSIVIHLEGDLGAGKTTFVKHLGKHLGIKDTIQSPTFTLMREYDMQDKVYNKLIHIDAYRFENKEEGDVLGVDELKKNNNVIIIEWPEKMNSYNPHITLSIKKNDDGTRDFMIN